MQIPTYPEDSEEAGKSYWKTMHNVASLYPMRPTPRHKHEFKRWLDYTIDHYVCANPCIKNAKKYLRANPLDMSSRKTLSHDLCKMHNNVRQEKGQQTASCDLVLGESLSVSNVPKDSKENTDADTKKESEPVEVQVLPDVSGALHKYKKASSRIFKELCKEEKLPYPDIYHRPCPADQRTSCTSFPLDAAGKIAGKAVVYLNPYNAGAKTIAHEFCLAGDTDVICNPRVITISEVKEGDKVLSHDGRFHKVTRTGSRLYSGSLYEIKPTGLESFRVTEDHPILAARRRRTRQRRWERFHTNHRLEWLLPSELSVGDYVVSPIFVNQPGTRNSIHHEYILGRKAKAKSIVNNIRLTPEVCRLMGYYLAEGGLVFQNRHATQVSLAFEKSEDYLVRDVIDICSRLDHTAKVTVTDKESHKVVNICSRNIASFLAECGHYSQNKRLPYMNLPVEQLRHIVRGYWWGDGYVSAKPRSTHFTASTISKTLAYQMKLILNKLGISAGLTVRPAATGRDGVFRQKAWTIIVSGARDIARFAKTVECHIGYLPKRSWKELKISRSKYYKNSEEYAYHPIRNIQKFLVEDFPVYNMSVEDTETYNANGVVVHNCHYLGKMRGNDGLAEDEEEVERRALKFIHEKYPHDEDGSYKDHYYYEEVTPAGRRIASMQERIERRYPRYAMRARPPVAEPEPAAVVQEPGEEAGFLRHFDGAYSLIEKPFALSRESLNMAYTPEIISALTQTIVESNMSPIGSLLISSILGLGIGTFVVFNKSSLVEGDRMLLSEISAHFVSNTMRYANKDAAVHVMDDAERLGQAVAGLNAGEIVNILTGRSMFGGYDDGTGKQHTPLGLDVLPPAPPRPIIKGQVTPAPMLDPLYLAGAAEARRHQRRFMPPSPPPTQQRQQPTGIPMPFVKRTSVPASAQRRPQQQPPGFRPPTKEGLISGIDEQGFYHGPETEAYEGEELGYEGEGVEY